MNNSNIVELSTQENKQIADKLNQLLANYQIYYQNVRGLHWNITGPQFFDLHTKFEELYTQAADNIDEIAERILTLDNTPLHSFQDYIDHSEIKAVTQVTEARSSVETIFGNLQVLSKLGHEILKLAAEVEDEGTATLISDMVTNQEKTTWMFKAYLKG